MQQRRQYPALFCLNVKNQVYRPVVEVASHNVIRDFKIGHYGSLGRLDRCHVIQNRRDLLPSSFWEVCFRRVSRCEDKSEPITIYACCHFSSKTE